MIFTHILSFLYHVLHPLLLPISLVVRLSSLTSLHPVSYLIPPYLTKSHRVLPYLTVLKRVSSPWDTAKGPDSLRVKRVPSLLPCSSSLCTLWAYRYVRYTTLHCTPLHCTTLNCTALHSIEPVISSYHFIIKLSLLFLFEFSYSYFQFFSYYTPNIILFFPLILFYFFTSHIVEMSST